MVVGKEFLLEPAGPCFSSQLFFPGFGTIHQFDLSRPPERPVKICLIKNLTSLSRIIILRSKKIREKQIQLIVQVTSEVKGRMDSGSPLLSFSTGFSSRGAYILLSSSPCVILRTECFFSNIFSGTLQTLLRLVAFLACPERFIYTPFVKLLLMPKSRLINETDRTLVKRRENEIKRNKKRRTKIGLKIKVFSAGRCPSWIIPPRSL